MKHLQISLQDILSATKDFAVENYIGTGASGNVYKGVSEKHGAIAIKRWDSKHTHGDGEFKMEIALLSSCRHENIVHFHGFCDEKGEKILVYKYECKGSLDKHLTNRDLTWTQRLRICLDAARGLKYLHDEVAPRHTILHRDVKSANILLDDNWKAKISDFGLSRQGPTDMESSFVISNACGTPGYIDPEYFYMGRLTPKSDVFSFGVVLFEVLSGRPAFLKVDRLFFYVWAQKNCKRRTLDKIIHSDLHKQINPASLLTFSSIAYQCLSVGEERPTMKEVVEQLQKALDNQLAPRSEVYNDFDFAALHHRHSRAPRASSSAHELKEYDVFFSYRGQDTHYTFVNNLYSELDKANFQILRGELIGSYMMEAINKSRIAIIIFSKTYADSCWCLDGLAYIMKCRDERGLIVIPVFYHVHPSEVLVPTHEFEKVEIVESWRKALAYATCLPKFVVTDPRQEGNVIEEIVYATTHRLVGLRASEAEKPLKYMIP